MFQSLSWTTITYRIHPIPSSGKLLGTMLTILEDSLHVQAVGGAGLVICAAFQVIRQLSGPWVVNHSGVGGTDCIWGETKHIIQMWDLNNKAVDGLFCFSIIYNSEGINYLMDWWCVLIGNTTYISKIVNSIILKRKILKSYIETKK